MIDGSAIATIIAALVALVSAIYASRKARQNRREQDEYSSRTPSPPSTQEVWTRLDRTERKLSAMVRIMHDIADQWPADAPAPLFNRSDLEILEDTMPPQWRTRFRPPPKPKRR